MLVANVMTRYVIGISPTSSIREAIRLMLRHKISSLPVIDERGMLVGILTESDFLRRVEAGTEHRANRWLGAFFKTKKSASEYIHEHSREVQDVMTKAPIITVTETTDLQTAAALMQKHKVKRVPVLRGNKVVGMLTRANLMKAVMTHGRALSEPQRADQDLRKQIIEEARKAEWLAAPRLDIQVKDGDVRIAGVVYDGRQEDALRVLIENIAGVKSVTSELVWIEPVSGTAITPQIGDKPPKIITLH